MRNENESCPSDALRVITQHMVAAQVVRIRFADGLEIEMHPSAFAPPPIAPAEHKPAPIGIENGGEPTEEQLLFYSAGGDLPRADKGDAS